MGLLCCEFNSKEDAQSSLKNLEVAGSIPVISTCVSSSDGRASVFQTDCREFDSPLTLSSSAMCRRSLFPRPSNSARIATGSMSMVDGVFWGHAAEVRFLSSRFLLGQ